MKKISVVFSHPDDESFATGGTIAKYVEAGYVVSLLCMTKGEEGEELKKAANILGISSVTVLDYRDGTLFRQNPGELENAIYIFLEETLPQVVITFEPNGISNHPDHIKTSFSTTYAFQKYATYLLDAYAKIQLYAKHDEVWFKRFESLREKQMEPKLYYVCVPERVVFYAQKQKMIPRESFGKPWKGVLDKHITTAIDVREFSKKKLEALAQHKTQIADVDRFVSVEGNPLFDKEFYMLRMQGIKEVFMGKNDEISDRL